MTNLFILASAQLVMLLTLIPLPSGIGLLLGSGLALVAAYAAVLAPALPRPAGATYPQQLRRARRRLLVRVALWLASPSLAPTGSLSGLTLDLPNLRASLALIQHPDQVFALVLTSTTAQTWIPPILVLLSFPVAGALLSRDLRSVDALSPQVRDRTPPVPALTRIVLTMPDRDTSGDPVHAARIAAELSRLGIRVTRVETEQAALSAHLADTALLPRSARQRGLRRKSTSASLPRTAPDQALASPDQFAGSDPLSMTDSEPGSVPGSVIVRSEDHLPPAQYSLDLDSSFLSAFLTPEVRDPLSQTTTPQQNSPHNRQSEEIETAPVSGGNISVAAGVTAAGAFPQTHS